MRRMADVATATSIMKDASAVETLTGKTFKVSWNDDDEPCDAYLVAADTSKILKKLQRIAKKLETVEPAKPAEIKENMHQNIGGGVLVSSATLARLEENFRDAPCKFARGLLRVLFTDEELSDKTLFGRQANSHKDQPTKAALDQNRVSAVLGVQ
ncbi:hypothetical protein MTO96_041564 [Rhipicephalus appendiculatus]